jgi:hypothetical protein
MAPISTLLDHNRSASSPGAIVVILAVSEAIREVGRIESGTLYALLCDRLSLAAYQGVISALKGADLVSESNHVLIWIGPELTKEAK